MSPEAEIEFIGKQIALEMMVRSFIQGMAVSKPDPQAFLLAKRDAMVATVRAANSKPGTSHEGAAAVERAIRHTFDLAALGLFREASDALATVTAAGRA